MAIHPDIEMTIDWESEPTATTIRYNAVKKMRLNNVHWCLMKQLCAYLDEATSIDQTLNIIRKYITVH